MNNTEGNRRLREMSLGQARSLAKIDMRDDPAAQARYKQYNQDQTEIKRTYGASFRGVERGGFGGKAE